MVHVHTFYIIFVALLLDAILIFVTSWLFLKIRSQSKDMSIQTDISTKEFSASHRAMIGPATDPHKLEGLTWEFHIYNYGKLTAQNVKFMSVIEEIQPIRAVVKNYDVDSIRPFMVFPKQDVSTKIPLRNIDTLHTPNSTSGKSFDLFFSYKCTYFLNDNKDKIGYLYGIIKFKVATTSNLYYYQNDYEIIDQWI